MCKLGTISVLDLFKVFDYIKSCHKLDLFSLKYLLSCMRAQHVLSYHALRILLLQLKKWYISIFLITVLFDDLESEKVEKIIHRNFVL